jgi:undecaprenyl diphosphate synthase
MHIGIIMDGNRRFAKINGLEIAIGHQKGLENLVELAEGCVGLGIDTLTVYALSTENFTKRSKFELENIFRVMKRGIKQFKHKLVGKNVRVRIMGTLQRLPNDLQEAAENLVESTKEGTKLLIQVCLNYGGREEIARAAQKAMENGETIITEAVIEKYLDSSLQPDLIIRPGGEMRVSNFLPWQGAYSELYFSDKNWPEFKLEDLAIAVSNYESRQRRFGK